MPADLGRSLNISPQNSETRARELPKSASGRALRVSIIRFFFVYGLTNYAGEMLIVSHPNCASRAQIVREYSPRA